MRYYPKSEHDLKDVAELNAAPWQVEALRLNPDYNGWGPHEDYMGDHDTGWDARVIEPTWKEFRWQLDDLNECVNFYFSLRREGHDCEKCEGSGYNLETKALSDTFYGPYAYTGWSAHLTQDEVDVLWENRRLSDWKEKPSVTAVNAKYRNGLGHDAINRWILVEQRAKRNGCWGKCEDCAGSGVIYTEPAAHLTLTLWIIHPRKGASRGVEVSHIEQDDLPAVYAWLRKAAERNAARFGRIPVPVQQ